MKNRVFSFLIPLFFTASLHAMEKVRQLLPAQPIEQIGNNDRPKIPPFHTAIRRGDRQKIEAFLTQPSALTSIDGDGYTPLHVAVQYGSPEIVTMLLSANAHKNAKSKDGETPLYSAVLAENEEVVRLLLKEGVDVNVRAANGWSALHLAAANGSNLLIKLLLEADARITLPDNSGRMPLHLAAANGYHEAAHLLIEAKAPISIPDSKGKTPLQIAAEGSYMTIVGLLLKAGAKDGGCNAKDWDGITPLANAIYQADRELMKLLARADASMCTVYNETALHWAAERGDSEMVQVCLAALALANDRIFSYAINLKNLEGKTPLRLAAQEHHVPVMKLLLGTKAVIWGNSWFPSLPFLKEAIDNNDTELVELLAASGADVNDQDKEKNTPLHWAANKGRAEIIAILVGSASGDNKTIYAKDSLNKPNKHGETPLYLAAKKSDIAIVKLLVKAGAKSKDLFVADETSGCVLDNNRRTMIAIAVIANDVELLHILLEAIRQDQKEPLNVPFLMFQEGKSRMTVYERVNPEAILNFKDFEGKTALHWAAERGSAPAVSMLLEHGAKAHVTDNKDDTPLHYAVREGHPKIVELLLTYVRLKEGNRAGPVDAGNMTRALFLALQRSDKNIAKMLIDLGGASMYNPDGGTVLFYLATTDCNAQSCHCYDILKLLVARGSEIPKVKTLAQCPPNKSPKHLFLRSALVLRILGGANSDKTVVQKKEERVIGGLRAFGGVG